MAPCYCRGSLIATPAGEVAVERLKIDDAVLTVSGASRPVRWIGRRSYGARFAASNPALWPVLIRAGALGHGLPVRDLRVSPLHAMYLDGLLIPAGQLVNGKTITQPRPETAFEYFHVELDSHDVIFAEGAPAETFLDDASRNLFHNVAEWEALYPGRKPVPAVYCARRVEGGFELETIRRRLTAVAQAA